MRSMRNAALMSAILMLCCPTLAQSACLPGQTFRCKNGQKPDATLPPCSDGPPQCCAGNVCSDAEDVSHNPQRRFRLSDTPRHLANLCTNPTCSSPPCAASVLGSVGCTTAAGVEKYNHEMVKKGGSIPVKSHIFGPFQTGFSQQQGQVVKNLGCTDATAAKVISDFDGGTDVGIAEQRVAFLCKIVLPRKVGDTYVGIVGPCGGHTHTGMHSLYDFHFHRSLSCLYACSAGHSAAVGNVAQWKMYGKWEDYTNKNLPYLDACGAHFGPTPDSGGKKVYHYHVQDKAPFTVGCHGPTADGKLVGIAACRRLYSKCTKQAVDFPISATKTVSYVRFCPCYDADGKNTGGIVGKELPALGTADISYTAASSVPDGCSGTSAAPQKPAPVAAPSKCQHKHGTGPMHQHDGATGCQHNTAGAKTGAAGMKKPAVEANVSRGIPIVASVVPFFLTWAAMSV